MIIQKSDYYEEIYNLFADVPRLIGGGSASEFQWELNMENEVILGNIMLDCDDEKKL